MSNELLDTSSKFDYNTLKIRLHPPRLSRELSRQNKISHCRKLQIKLWFVVREARHSVSGENWHNTEFLAVLQSGKNENYSHPRLKRGNLNFRIRSMLPQFNSVQFKMVSMRSEKPTCASTGFSEVSQRCLWHSSKVRLIDDGLFSSFQGRSSSLSPSGGRWCDVLTALCLQVMFQAPQQFRSSATQITGDGCFLY